MKHTQESAGSQPCLFPSTEAGNDRYSSCSKGRSNALLLLQLRTELEGKWRPDKLGIARKWMSVSPKQWFCQKEDVFEFSIRQSTNSKSMSKSNSLKQQRKKPRAQKNAAAKTVTEKCGEHPLLLDPTVEFGECPEGADATRRNERRTCRLLLEEEVMILQKRLHKEMDVRRALEDAMDERVGALSKPHKDLPNNARQLLTDIAALENVVSDLEEQSTNLQYQLIHERKERDDFEQAYSSSRCFCKQQGSSPGVALVSRTASLERGCWSPLLSSSAVANVVERQTLIAKANHQEVLTLQDHLRLTSVVRSHPSSRCAFCGSGRYTTSCSSQSPDLPARFSPSISSSQTAPSPSSESSAHSPLSLPVASSNEYGRSGYAETTRGTSSANFPESVAEGRRASVDRSCSAYPEEADDDSDFSFPYSPAAVSDSGDFKDVSGRCFSTSAKLGSSSPVISGYCALSTSPPSPEHRVRPTSPASFDDLRFLCDAPSEGHVKELSKVLPSTEQSSPWSKNSEEFHSPQASSSLGDYLSGESKPPSAEKPRRKFRVKLNLQEEFANSKSRKALSSARDETTPNSMVSLLLPTEYPEKCMGFEDDQFHFRDYSQTPNLLSEEMVRCMMSIYCHLADPAVVTPPVSSYDSMPSPTSPLGHVNSSSFSSVSESSLVSLTRSPLVDLRSKEDVLGSEGSMDPYRFRGRLPWADIGAYSKALEVPWMGVSKDQLGFVSEALLKFRSLVEQLSYVNLRRMLHPEKLAFWINLYNALMMHAYLAYGVPRNDLKYFALLHKAAYNVGGHSFSAATIEYSLLRGKAPSYRHQIGLLMALFRSKSALSDDQKSLAIDYPEPQMVFALCCGARSSPAVRIFTADLVHRQLNMCLRDYARASVGLSAKGKLLVPKLLYTYAREFVEESAVLDWICQILPANQGNLVHELWQQRSHRLLGARKLEVLAFDFNFRYLFAPSFDCSGDLC